MRVRWDAGRPSCMKRTTRRARLAGLGMLALVAVLVAACATGENDDAEIGPSGTILTVVDTSDGDATAVPLDGTTVSGSLHLVVELANHADEVRFYLDDGADPIGVDDEAPYEHDFASTDLSDGVYTITVVAADTARGLARDIARASFTVANGAPSGPLDEDVTYEGPIVITTGGTYSGNWESTDPSVPAIHIDTGDPVVIENAHVRSIGHLILARGDDAHITIRNTYGRALPPRHTGDYPGRFLLAEQFEYVSVENSYLDGTSGIYLHDSVVGATARILRNRVRNVDGRYADGHGGYDGRRYVQFVQINRGRDLTDTEIAWNEVINEPFHSAVEDVINLFTTTGAADDPVRIHDNYIRGAYPPDPRTDRYSGGGIMLGDGGGSHLHAYGNMVVNTTNYGIAISGGTHNSMDDNTVVSCGRLPDGSQLAAHNVGIYIWNMDDAIGFTANRGSGNSVGWSNADGTRNDWWTPDADEWEDNRPMDAVDCGTERDVYAAWLRKVDAAQASIGPLD